MANKKRPKKAAVNAALAEAHQVLAEVCDLLEAHEHTRGALANEVESHIAQQVIADVHHIALDDLPTATGYPLRIAALQRAGFTSSAQLLGITVDRLMSYPNIGSVSARGIVSAMTQLHDKLWQQKTVQLVMDPPDDPSLRMVAALKADREINEALTPVISELVRIRDEFPLLLQRANLIAQPLRYMFSSRKKRQDAVLSFDTLQQWLTWVRQNNDTLRAAQRAVQLSRNPANVGVLCEDFERHSSRYYAHLEQRFSLGVSNGSPDTGMPEGLVDSVDAVHLNLESLSTPLRRYQEFGAKYIIAQRRSLLGDEMGLGKTIQTLAAICHLTHTNDNAHFLVICPASVIVNWSREIQRHTSLRCFIAHGTRRDKEWRRWHHHGGVALTTYDTLPRVNNYKLPTIELLALDEAHYVKNPNTLRAQEVSRVLHHAHHVTFLTGTPMHNHLGEFTHLIDMLQPDIGPTLPADISHMKPEEFHQAVAPVYLRRNAEDVITELPELTVIDEWEPFTDADAKAYQDAVISGNFMSMRRAAFHERNSAKMKRLKEICTEAHDNNRRVIIFSFFLDVLTRLTNELPFTIYGPITGAVPPAQRQTMIDSFSDSSSPGILLAQITAGGEGLNIQAASVVILCEPQIKPSLEKQAIARAHRMGQTRHVQAHRLLTPDSVDTRMLDILTAKEHTFETYIKDSHAANTSSHAKDPTETTLGHTIIRLEAQRLGLTPRQRTQQHTDTSTTPQT